MKPDKLNEPQHCDFCGAPPGVATTLCAPPFKVQLHQWTGQHPADKLHGRRSAEGSGGPMKPDLSQIKKLAEAAITEALDYAADVRWEELANGALFTAVDREMLAELQVRARVGQMALLALRAALSLPLPEGEA